MVSVRWRTGGRRQATACVIGRRRSRNRKVVSVQSDTRLESSATKQRRRLRELSANERLDSGLSFDVVASSSSSFACCSCQLDKRGKKLLLARRQDWRLCVRAFVVA